MMSMIAAGVLMIPAVLVMIGTLPVVAILSLPGLALLCYSGPKRSTKADVSQKTRTSDNNTSKKQREDKQQRRRAIITGGSSGIGLAVAEECVRQGFNEVIVMARNVDKLNQTKERLKALLLANESNKNATRIDALSVDVTEGSDLKNAADKIFGSSVTTAKNDKNNSNNDDHTKDDSENDDMFTCLFCVAGVCYPDYFSKTPASTFVKTVQTNQLGSMYTVQAFLPHMTTGTIMLTSSVAGLLGPFGYSSYSPTKFALRGFAECLHMELVARPISVSVAYPSDTDTPGFETENITKPPECKFISEEPGLSQPQDIARIMVHEACKENPKFAVCFNLDGWIVATVTAGFSPVMTLLDAIAQVAGMGLLRVVSLFYLKSWTTTLNWYYYNEQNATRIVPKQETTPKDIIPTEKSNLVG